MPANYPYIQVPFATSGDKDTIPVQTDPSGAVSFTQGYGPDYQRDLETDPLAKPIERGGMNQLFYAVTAGLKAWQENTLPEWVPSSEAGGIPLAYPLGVWVRYTSGGTTSLYVSLEANNTETPGAGTKWAQAPFRVANPSEMAAGAGSFPPTLSQVRTLITTYAPVPPDASLSQKGVVQLSSALNDPADNSKAATPGAVARKFGSAIASLGASDSLDALTAASARGTYWQDNDANATTANGYPVGATAGALLVMGAVNGAPMQVYFTPSGRVWTRSRNAGNTAWNAWVSVSDGYGTPIVATDYNAITVNGQYSFGASAANRPAGFGASWAIHFASSGAGGTVAFDTASGNVAYRPLTSGGFGAWSTVYTSSNFSPVTNVGASLRNLRGSANGTLATANYSADVLPMMDNAGRTYVAKPTSFSINTGATGLGGIDTGSVAPNTHYAVWAVSNGSAVGGVASTNFSTPTLPAGYTFFTLVGAFRTDGTGKPLGFNQFNEWVYPKVQAGSNVPNLPIVAGGVAGAATVPTWVQIGLSSVLPPNATEVALVARVPAASRLIAAPNASYGAVSSAANPPPIILNSASGTGDTGGYAILPLETNSIYWAADNPGGQIAVSGWRINL